MKELIEKCGTDLKSKTTQFESLELGDFFVNGLNKPWRARGKFYLLNMEGTLSYATAFGETAEEALEELGIKLIEKKLK